MEEAPDEWQDSERPWVEAAVSDDALAAEVLMRLSQAKRALPPLQWGHRQPRSRQVLRSGILFAKEMEASRAARASPTTPLSWSGGSSGSADGCEESSRSRKRPLSAALDDIKSKMAVHEDGPVRSTVRRTRKKKFAELKKEVDLLVLEKSKLKKELERLARSRKQLKLKNESLKQLQSIVECVPPKKTTDTVSNASHHPTREIFDLNLPAKDDEAASSPPSDELYGMS